MSDVARKQSSARVTLPRVNPVLIWGLCGVLFMGFVLYVLGTWISSATFRRHTFDMTSVAPLTWQVIQITQIISPIITVIIVVRFLLLPWLRQRRLTTDGMLVITWFFLWFQDPMGNFVRTQLYYSSVWFNMGSWTRGSFPGWVSPAGNNLPEPLMLGLGYIWLGFLGGVACCWVMGKARQFRPHARVLELMIIALAVGVILDIAVEVPLIMAGTFAWPCIVSGLALFPGTPDQFPMSEGMLFGATIAAGGVLRFFRDEHGDTWVEQGIARLASAKPVTTAIRFFAIFGFMQLFMATIYSVPMGWLGTHTNVCLHYPSHLENGMSGAGLGGVLPPAP